MSFVNLPPDAPFIRLDNIIQRQRRLFVLNIAATVIFAGSLVASLASLASLM